MIFLFSFRGEWGNWELMGAMGANGSSWEFYMARENWKFRKVLMVRKFRKLRMC